MARAAIPEAEMMQCLPDVRRMWGQPCAPGFNRGSVACEGGSKGCIPQRPLLLEIRASEGFAARMRFGEWLPSRRHEPEDHHGRRP
jgi:hypothetical protein